MSTITTIQGTDVISTSRTTINTNFANLNSDKEEVLTESGSRYCLGTPHADYEKAFPDSKTRFYVQLRKIFQVP